LKKVLAVILTVSVLMGICFTGTIFAEDKTVVIACSDFQPKDGNTSGKTVLEGLVNSLKNEGITSADGFLCCGDYDYEYAETKQGIEVGFQKSGKRRQQGDVRAGASRFPYLKILVMYECLRLLA